MGDPTGDGKLIFNGLAPESGRYDRVLVVVAHPDDSEFFFGATVARLVRLGSDVRYVICSDGALGGEDPRTPRIELVAARCEEQRAAAAVLGVREVLFLGYPDGTLAPTLVLRRAIVRAVRRVRPQLVLTHYPHRALGVSIQACHPDHMAVGEATLRAVYPDAGNARVFGDLLEEGLEPHRVTEVWLAGCGEGDHFVDATPFLEKKIESILCHRSQLDGEGALGPPLWMYEWMKGVGRRGGVRYAEDFKCLPVWPYAENLSAG